MRAQSVKANPRVVACIPFVEQLARRVAATMPHSIDIGDLVQDGVIGLIDAARRFDEGRGIKFETFAERRIRGAMIDALRKDAWPRGVRRQRRELEAAREELRRELGCEPSLADLAAKVGSDEKRLGRTIVRINAIESTSPLANNDRIDESSLPQALIPSEPEQPDTCLRARRNTGSRARSDCLVAAARAESDQPLLLRRSDDEADRGGNRRERVTRVAASRARCSSPSGCPERDCPGGRGCGRHAQHAAGLPSQATDGQGHVGQQAAAAAGPAPGVVVVYPSVSRTARSKLTESERLGEPAAAAVFEEALCVGAGHVAGDKDDPARQRGRRRRDGTVERHPVDARHLEVADDHVVRVLPQAGEGFLAVACVIHGQTGGLERFHDDSRQRALVFDEQDPCAADRLHGQGRRCRTSRMRLAADR